MGDPSTSGIDTSSNAAETYRRQQEWLRSAVWENFWEKQGPTAIQNTTTNLQTLGLNPPCGPVDILGILSEGLNIPEPDLETEFQHSKIPTYPYQDQTILPLCK